MRAMSEDEVEVFHSYALLWTDESHHVTFYIDQEEVSSRHFPSEYLEGLKRVMMPETENEDD
jgi:hypothetical protein